MRNRDVCKKFFEGSGDYYGSNLYCDAKRIFSYKTCIGEIVDEDDDYITIILNTTKYSATTSKHQSYLKYALQEYQNNCNKHIIIHTIDNVEMGARYLWVIYKNN
jgi:hypothetical protein